MRYVLLNIILFLLLVSFSCNTTGPTPTRDVELKVSDVSCTEAWLKLALNNFTGSAKVELKRDGSTVNTFDITSADMVLYDDSLSPNKAYSYQVIELQNGTVAAKSEMITARTMDTTSNNFTWQTFTFGGNAGSCLLNDVAIVNDTIAYAVGKIFVNDSTGKPDPAPYNFVKWNGNKWTIKKITVDYLGNLTTVPLKGIFVIPNGSIILSGGVPYLPDKNGDWKIYQLWDMGILNQNDGSVNSIWGSSIDDLCFVGNKGTIVHYSNGNWQKIESGTRTDINDIWGYIDPNTGQSVELCAVSFVYSIGDYKILKIQDNKVDSLKWNMRRGIHSIWTKNGFPIYAVGDGVFNNSSGHWKEEIGISSNYKESIRGTGLNDIYVCGDFGLFAHFNGMRWKVYKNLAINGIYTSLAVKGNLVIAVGTDNGKAIIVMGRRN